MSHECEKCGASFETLSRLRLHECSLDSAVADTSADDWSDENPPVEEEYPALVGDLPSLIDDAHSGDLSVLYRAVAEYERVLAEAPTDDGIGSTGPNHEIWWEYYKPLADGLDAAAQANGWDVLTEFMDAYDPREQDSLPEVTHVVANAVGRSIVRMRLCDGVDAIPAEALAYLGTIPEYTDEFTIPYEESYTYGWGIGHPEHSVSDRLVALADTAHKWTSVTLNTAFYADQHAAVDVLERLVTDDRLTGTIQRIAWEADATRYYFGAVADLELEVFSPHVPLRWDWEAELNYSFELDIETEQRIRDLAHEVGVVDDLPADWTLHDLEPGPLSDFKNEIAQSAGEEP